MQFLFLKKKDSKQIHKQVVKIIWIKYTLSRNGFIINEFLHLIQLNDTKEIKLFIVTWVNMPPLFKKN